MTTMRAGRGQRRTCWWCRVALAALALATICSFAGALGWVLELAAHFRVQWAFTAAGLLIVSGVVRDWRACAGAALVLGLHVAAIVPLYRSPGRTPTEPGARLRLLLANVHSSNTEHQALLNLVRVERPDLVLLEEVTRPWLAALAALHTEYPFSIEEARDGNFGIALLSRRRLIEPRIRRLGSAELPSIEARIRYQGRTLRILLTHPLPPVQAEAAALRDEQIGAVAQFVRAVQEPTLLLGDLNTTPWARSFRRLADESGLMDSTRGFGWQPTWPTGLPWLLRIPIDPCLHTRDLRVVDRRVGPSIGSDHRPLLLGVRWTRSGG